MNDLILKLRQQLISMIEEIDNFKTASENTLIIKKADFKSINYLGKLNSYIHLFEYKNGAKFILRQGASYPYDLETYQKLMNGTLEILILTKRENEYISSGHSINYELEDKHKTILRNLYSPIEETNDQAETHND
jgi:hypothetical protein